ncbi:hypothetical protein D3C81_1545680 [compost metagenome]
MIEWYFSPGASGNVADFSMKGSLAFKLSMLVVMRGSLGLLPASSGFCKARNTSPNLPRMVSGKRTSLPIIRPSRLPAASVPLCGEAMKIARSTFGCGVKCSSGPNRASTRFRRSPSSLKRVSASFHSTSPELLSIKRAITPPMLWPMNTMSCVARAVPFGSKCFSVPLKALLTV